MTRIGRLFSLSALILITSACGVAHVNTETAPINLSQYELAQIGDVKVYSEEANAQNNEPLQAKLIEWTESATNQLENAIAQSSLTLQSSTEPSSSRTLIFSLDSNVRYGNRALRWAVGFGAGKGGVETVLSVVDAATGEQVYRATASSDLSMGGAGGNMDAVFRSNINELIAQYRLDNPGR